MAVVVIALDHRVLDRAVHPLDLTIGPRMVHLGQPVLDVVLGANAAEDVREGIGVLLAVGELNAIIRQDDVDAVGYRQDQIAQELRRFHLAGTLDQTNEGELAGAVDRHEQGELAFFGADLCDIDMKVADRILLEAFLLRLVGFDLRQAADAVSLQAPVQAGAGQMREGRCKP